MLNETELVKDDEKDEIKAFLVGYFDDETSTHWFLVQGRKIRTS